LGIIYPYEEQKHMCIMRCKEEGSWWFPRSYTKPLRMQMILGQFPLVVKNFIKSMI
jgi:hypothetical protein